MELLNRVLAKGQPNSARVIISFSTVHGDAIASAVAPIKREAALRGLLNPKILVRGKPCGIRDTRSEQSKSEVIAPINREIGDIVLRERVGLACPLCFHERRCGGHFHLGRQARQFEAKVKNQRLPDGQGEGWSYFCLKT